MPPPWLIDSLDAEERFLSGPDPLPARLKMVREAFAGAAMLTRCMRARGISTGRPLEAYPSIDNTGRDGKYICWCDLDCPETARNLSLEIRWGLCMYIHFGLVCKSWPHLNTFNGGTRTK